MNALTEYTFYRGRVALYAILKAMGIGPGDEVILQAFTCVAVPEAILAAGATPIYADVADASVNMDPGSLAERITPRTKAVIVQHTFGIPCEMGEITEIANAHSLAVIEDCAHSVFSSHRGRQTGSIGDAAFYSFEWGKPIIAGIGGAAVINDEKLRERFAAAYASYGPPTGSALKQRLQYAAFELLYRPRTYWHVRRAFHLTSRVGLATGNYNPIDPAVIPADFSWRMSDFHTRKLAGEIAMAEVNIANRRRIVEKYRHGISSSGIHHVSVPAGGEAVYTRYPLIIGTKSDLLTEARKRNIEIAPWYLSPVHPLAGDELDTVGYSRGICPRAERLAGEIISLPVSDKVSNKDISRTIAFLNGFGK